MLSRLQDLHHYFSIHSLTLKLNLPSSSQLLITLAKSFLLVPELTAAVTTSIFLGLSHIIHAKELYTYCICAAIEGPVSPHNIGRIGFIGQNFVPSSCGASCERIDGVDWSNSSNIAKIQLKLGIAKTENIQL